jgi:hypothetical protein
LPARDTSRDATRRLVDQALDAALRLNVEGVFLDAAQWREVITRVQKDDGAREALGIFARGIVQKAVTKRRVPVSVTLTLMYKMLWHAKVVSHRITTPQAMKDESKRRLNELDRIERFLRRLGGDALDSMHGFGRVDPTLVPPAALMAVAELRAVLQQYGAAAPELRAQFGTTTRTGGGITKRELKTAKQAAISAFAAALFNLSGAQRDSLVARLVGAAFGDSSVSDRDVLRLRSRFLDKLDKRS